ncbi:MAG: DEAD/DEAH box helicase [Coriobacteriia bacterium]|nr:DEAD/DEAH box helicase [Coriobacteriia bacterium]
MSNFDSLGLSARALEAVSHLGYTEATEIQERAIPLVLEGHDIIAAAKTGTGKTAAFSLPCMDMLDPAPKNKKKPEAKKGEAHGRNRSRRGQKQRQGANRPTAEDGRAPRMLVITPTRELANQICQVCETVAASTGHQVLCVVGGLSYGPQISELQRGVDVLIATPGRLVDLIGQDAVDLSLVQTLILDEADRMLDMGFLPSVMQIIDKTPEPGIRQTLLFSATIDDAVRKMSHKILKDPKSVEVAHRGETADGIDQYLIRISHAAKPSLLKAVLEQQGGSRIIVFARTRHRADACARRIRKMGLKVEAIHSDRTQNQRQRALDGFAKGRVNVLVATDVLARGIDVSGVDYVVNYDLPTQPEDYVHRIGRTGRAGAKGLAISFVSPETESFLTQIEKLIKQDIPTMEVPGFDKAAAEADAADRSLQLQARRSKDPEVEAVAKELAEKRRKKSKAQAKAMAAALDAVDGQGRRKRTSPKGANQTAPAPKSRSGKKGKGGAKAKPAGSARHDLAKARARRKPADAAEQPRRNDAPAKAKGRGAAGKPKAGAGKGAAKRVKRPVKPAASKGDFRPGRAHRAAVASSRRG